MAEIPRDPRQLARDILAGRISIEQLAREQQRGAGGVVRPPQQRLPERVPLPRTPQQPTRPVVRQVPAIPQRQAPRPPVVIKSPAPQRRVQAAPAARAAVVTPQAPAGPMAPQTMAEAFASPVKAPLPAGQLAIDKVMRNRAALRQCIVMAEVLGKPVGLREEW